MREIKDKALRIENVEFKLTEDKIMELGAFLDSKPGLHILEVYFTRNGDHFFNKHNFKDGKSTKQYSRLVLELRPFEIDNRGQQLYKNMRIGLPENEIVETIDAEVLIDKYLKLKYKK